MMRIGIGLYLTGGGSAVDPLAPGKPSLDLVAASDSGSSSTDNITSDTTPDIDITGATIWLENDHIHLYDNGVLLVDHTVTLGEAGGSAIALGLSALSEGVHSLTAKHSRDGHVSPASAALSITVDTTAPTITTGAAQSVEENAAFSLDLAANESVTWTKTGGADQALFTLAAANLSMTAKNYEAPTDADANNTYVVQVTATDAAGNTTNKTITVTVTDAVEAATTRESMTGGSWLPAFVCAINTGNRQSQAFGSYNVEN